MKLLNPWGLLLMLSIPLLVWIYILKREYKQKNVGTAWLWRISDRFLKKRNPLRLITMLLAFILQLSLLALTAFGAAAPTLPLGSVSPQIVIIDASASMQTSSGGETRFERAVKEAEKLSQSPLCSSMTVIIASDVPYSIVNDASPAEVREALSGASCSWGGCSVFEALRLVHETWSGIGSPRVIFYTDMDYAYVENVEVVDMRADEINVAVTNPSHIAGTFRADVTCFGEDREVAVALYVDGELIDTQTVRCTDGQPAKAEFRANINVFKEAEIRTNENDALAADDSAFLVSKTGDKVRVLICGQDTMFLKAGLEAVGRCEITEKERYLSRYDGRYDLFVFTDIHDCDKDFPERGNVLAFSSNDFKSAGRVTPFGVALKHAKIEDKLMLSNHEEETDPLMRGIGSLIEEVYVGECNTVDAFYGSGGVIYYNGKPAYLNGKPEPLLFYNTGDTALVRRVTPKNDRQYLFCFDVHNSNLVLTPAFLIILENMVDIAVPPPVEKTAFEVGDEVRFTLPSEYSLPCVINPEGTELQVNGLSPVCVPNEPGVWTLRYNRSDNIQNVPFAVTIPFAEYRNVSEDAVFMPALVKINEMGDTQNKTFEQPLAAVLLLLLMVEWGYCLHGRH